MNNPLRNRILVVAAFTATIGAALTATAAQAMPAPSTSKDYGQLANGAPADRHIVVTPQTRNINVNNGDTIEFQSASGSFTWHFDTLHREDAFQLSKIAPAGTLDQQVMVYVGSNPLYR